MFSDGVQSSGKNLKNLKKLGEKIPESGARRRTQRSFCASYLIRETWPTYWCPDFVTVGLIFAEISWPKSGL